MVKLIKGMVEAETKSSSVSPAASKPEAGGESKGKKAALKAEKKLSREDAGGGLRINQKVTVIGEIEGEESDGAQERSFAPQFNPRPSEHLPLVDGERPFARKVCTDFWFGVGDLQAFVSCSCLCNC